LPRLVLPCPALSCRFLSCHAFSRLDFIQNMEYKYVELMSCSCVQSPAEVIQNQITFRYNSMKQKVSILNARLHEINSLVKTKNPSLLLQLQKTTSTKPLDNGLATSERRR
jgi:hypothetical protein